MQLNHGVVRGIRGVRSFWISLIAIIVGLIFVGFGIYFLVTDPAKKYEDATATITAVNTEMIGEDEIYHVTLKYTDKNGIEHTGVEMSTYDNTWTVGKEVQIKYNINDFNDVKSTSSPLVFSFVAIGLGAISVLVGIFGIIKTIKILKRKANTEITSNGNTKNESKEENLSDIKLFFHYTGKLNQSYSVEDKKGQIFYECKLVKFSLLGASTFEFINHIADERIQHKIGKTVSSYSEGGLPIVGDILSSSFKIDGENCWDYVARKGYEIKHMLEGKSIINYQIVKNGKIVAKVFPADVRKPFDENSTGYLFMNKGYYRLEIIDAKLSDVVMIAFIVGRTAVVE